jgi:hypothetical protein
MLWYDEARVGLGTELLETVDAALARIAEAPHTFPVDGFDPRARRALLQRFPYAIVFVMQEGEVRVVAFAHLKRRPGFWRGRE